MSAVQLEKATGTEDPEEELICFLVRQQKAPAHESSAEAALLSELRGLKLSDVKNPPNMSYMS
jgi:hypothetical protein